jgi:hypothetical protein
MCVYVSVYDGGIGSIYYIVTPCVHGLPYPRLRASPSLRACGHSVRARLQNRRRRRGGAVCCSVVVVMVVVGTPNPSPVQYGVCGKGLVVSQCGEYRKQATRFD